MNPKPYNSFIPICRNTLIKRKEGDKRKDLDLILRHATKQPQISRPLAKNGSGGFTWLVCWVVVHRPHTARSRLQRWRQNILTSVGGGRVPSTGALCSLRRFDISLFPVTFFPRSEYW